MFSRRALLPRSDARSVGMGAVRQAGCIASYGPNLQDAYIAIWPFTRTRFSRVQPISCDPSIVERRYAANRTEILRPLAEELIRFKVEIIVTNGTTATLAAKNATTTIPIVMFAAGDPVAAGFAASLARPGGNITGHSPMATFDQVWRDPSRWLGYFCQTFLFHWWWISDPALHGPSRP